MFFSGLSPLPFPERVIAGYSTERDENIIMGCFTAEGAKKFKTLHRAIGRFAIGVAKVENAAEELKALCRE